MKKLLLLTIIGLIAVAAVACSKDTGTFPTPASELPVATSEAQPPATPPAQAMEKEKDTSNGSEPITEPPAGDVFRRLWADPPTLDPALVTDTTSAGVIVEIFSGLVTINTDLQLVPDLAESWTISEDGLVYTFKIRDDAKFHDGKPVTANDFKWSIERTANPKTASPVADTYLSDIVGVKDVLDGVKTNIDGIKVIDDHTIQFTIDAPKAYFLAKLTYPTAYVLDRENVEEGGRTWTDHPNGTGPFKLKEYRIGERIVLERNPYYTREQGGVETILMQLAGGQSMAMYENNEIDVTGVGLFDLERVQDPNEALNRELVIAPASFNISYVGFNTAMPPFDDPKFRQALNHAVDKELISREVLSNLVRPAYGVLPPGFPGYNPDLVGLKYDPDLAKRLLSESKYSDPDARPRIVLTVPGTGGTVGLDLEVVLEMWRQVLGVQVEIQQVEWATFLQDLNRQRYQAFAGLGWEADYPDPQDFLDILFHTDSSLNHGGYSNTQADAILEKARVEQDVQARVALYREAEELIVADAAWVPLWFESENYVLIKPYVKGYRLTPMIVPKLRQIRIEK